MDSDLSELSASDINDASSNASFGDSEESSRSSNFATRWPETHANTYQFIRDAELDTKKFQLERNANELEGYVLDREIELQAEIRDVNSQIGDLRLEIAQQERNLSEIKEARTNEILRIRQNLMTQCHMHEATVTESKLTIEQLSSAIEAQRAAHERDLMALTEECDDEAARLDRVISDLNAQISSVRQRIREVQQKNENDANDARLTMDMLVNELRTIDEEGAGMLALFEKVNGNVTELKRELIIAEETSQGLREQIQTHMKLRSQMKDALGRGKRQMWETQTRYFDSLR